tara:strand:- start:429 stop:731 length:303 start_codon:yes stop_codon:yes gene_type:complete
MQLLTKQIKKRAKPLGATDGDELKPVLVKYFTPWSNWTWYAVEFDGDDLFFGYVEGHDNEWGYFSLSDLESIDGPFGLKVERDLFFEKKVINVDGKVGDA